MELRRSKVSNVDYYELVILTTDSLDNIFLSEHITDTFKIISDLQKNQTYYWKVRAIKTDDQSDWSEIWSFNTNPISKVYDNISNDGIFITPNPTDNHIYIDFFSTSEISILKIYDILGSCILEKNICELSNINNRIYIDVSNFNPGLYFIRLGNKFYKFVKL